MWWTLVKIMMLIEIFVKRIDSVALRGYNLVILLKENPLITRFDLSFNHHKNLLFNYSCPIIVIFIRTPDERNHLYYCSYYFHQ